MDYDAEFIRLRRQVKELQDAVATLGGPRAAAPQQVSGLSFDSPAFREEMQKMMEPLTELKEQVLDRLELLEIQVKTLTAPKPADPAATPLAAQSEAQPQPQLQT